jgi:hypothetical protein
MENLRLLGTEVAPRVREALRNGEGGALTRRDMAARSPDERGGSICLAQ